MTAAGERQGLGDVGVLYLRRRADVKIARALRIEALRLSGRPHQDIRVQLGLSVEQYRRARRWLRAAVARSVGSREPLSVEDALRQHGAHHVATAVRLGSLAAAGYPRADIMRMLRLTIEEYEQAHEWLRDAIAREPRDDDED